MQEADDQAGAVRVAHAGRFTRFFRQRHRDLNLGAAIEDHRAVFAAGHHNGGQQRPQRLFVKTRFVLDHGELIIVAGENTCVAHTDQQVLSR